MPNREAYTTSLCNGLERCQWNTVLSFGRRVRINGHSWLESHCEGQEIIAIFLKGCVGMRPVPTDSDEKWDAQISHSPVIIHMTSDPDSFYCHWVADHAEVYFYTSRALLKSIISAPYFACNIIETLCLQQEKLSENNKREVNIGVKRLTNSLLARAGNTENASVVVFATQADLAFETGLSRQWVNHLLREMERKGLAKLGRGRVILSSPSALKKNL